MTPACTTPTGNFRRRTALGTGKGNKERIHWQGRPVTKGEYAPTAVSFLWVLQPDSVALLATSRTEAHRRLARVVDPPLEARQCAGHEHARTQPLRRKRDKSRLSRDLAEALAAVRRVAHETTESAGWETTAQPTPAT